MQLSDIGYHAPLGKSDHCVITFKHYCYLGYSQPKERYVYHKTHFNSMSRQLLLSNWTEKFIIQNQSKSVDELWNSFKSAMHEIRNKLFENNLVEFRHGKLRVACQLIKSFVMLCGTKVSCTGDGYHQKIF